jgi:hypothetical protein
LEEGELRKVVTSEVLASRRGKGATSDCSPQSSIQPPFASDLLPTLHMNKALSGRSTAKLFRIQLIIPPTKSTFSVDSSNMELPPLSVEQLSKLAASNVPPSQLYEILSQYETDASIMSAGSGSAETGGGDPQLLSLFYSSFFFAHLLTKQL